MEILQRNAELIRIAADLVERDKARVPVVRGVLNTLGHRRAAQLLHAQRQIVTMIMESRTELINGWGPARDAVARPSRAHDQDQQHLPADTSGKP